MVFVSYLKNYGCSRFPCSVVRLIVGACGPLFSDIIAVSAVGALHFLQTMHVLAAVFDSGSPFLSWQLVAGVALRMLEPLISFDSVAE